MLDPTLSHENFSHSPKALSGVETIHPELYCIPKNPSSSLNPRKP